MSAGGYPEPLEEKQKKETKETNAELELLRAKEAKRQEMAKQGLDERGIPLLPEFQSIVGEGGGIKEGYGIGEFDPVQRDTAAADRMRQLAFQEGPTDIAQRQLQAQQLEQAGQFDAARRGQAGAQRAAFDALARQGGLGGGSRERLARAGQRQGILGRQQLRSQGARDRAGILTRDEDRKLGLLGKTQDAADKAAQFGQSERQFEAQRRQFDIGTRMQELQGQRESELRDIESRRKAIAAEKSANAQRASSGGCFHGDTLIKMADGLFKKISDIKLGECVSSGGTIGTVLQFKVKPGTDVYEYDGIIVTGSHAVLEGNEWVRVRDSKKAIPYTGEVDVVYNFANENHLIETISSVFADYDEVDDVTLSYDDSLALMNERLSKKIKPIAERQALI
jgi:hypothetical protein